MVNVRGWIGWGLAGCRVECAQPIGAAYADSDPNTNSNTERVAYAKPYGVPFAFGYGNSHANT